MKEKYLVKIYHTNTSDTEAVQEAAINSELLVLKNISATPVSISQLRIGLKIRNTILYKKQTI